ncbi:MAG: FAD-dependent thymidylate synthase [bacterium]
MKVALAGYNIDADIIEELKKKSNWSEDNITPETLSAAYARISRDPDDISKLREKARIETEKARKSNENIIFGLGHSSVAEHAVFNLDIIGLSRLAVEDVQKFRFASFTEKSQRYIKLDGDFVAPEEFKGNELAKEFSNLINLQNSAYFSLYETLRDHFFTKFADKITTKNGKITVEGWAKEDARYVLSLATTSQFGMTVNARTLENMLRQFSSSPLLEIRELGTKIYEIVHTLSPSIIKYTKPTPYDMEKEAAIKRVLEKSNIKSTTSLNNFPLVKLHSFTEDPDNILCSSIIYTYTGSDFDSSLNRARSLSRKEKKELVKSSLYLRESYDKVERAFEQIEFTFELVVSATNYAQLKRHRVCSQIAKDYDTSLKYTTPPSIVESGQTALFSEIMEKSEEFYHNLAEFNPNIKNYALTNAHRKRVLIKLNARELYHFTSLRDDEYAQWDIRETAKEMRQLAADAAPLTSMMLCGKSDFEKQKSTL